MKSFVRITILPEGTGRGVVKEYIVDDALSDHGQDIAAELTTAIDTRPDVAGRLAELRRHLAQLVRVRPRSHAKPSGARSVGARVQYNVVSRTTGRTATVQMRHHDRPEGVAPNPDED